MNTRFLGAVSLGAALSLSAGAARAHERDDEAERGRRTLRCDVAIIGGGPGGLHTAYRLGPTLHGNVCLFEKEDRLGGRIYDISRVPGGPRVGLGARRIMEGQTVVFSLADELGITYEPGPWKDDLLSSRGYFAFNSDDLNASAYPLVADAETETTLYDKLRFGPERANAHLYPDFRSYVRKVVGTQGYQFLTDVFRFRADFTYPLDARGYLDYLDEEWDVCCTPSYPVGGMSEFIRRMEARSRAQGVRIYKSEPALDISGRGRDYVITTPSYRVRADKLIIAVDAEAFKRVKGDVAAAIQSQPQFNDLIGVKVAVIAQFWANKWWEGSRGKDIRRAWTTEHCLNAIEMPTTPYGESALATRSVYDDDYACVQFWENTASRGTAAVNAEIKRGLQYLFPDKTIPEPLKTVIHFWPTGWYWLRGGSQYTNADIARWAMEPVPGEDIALVGESYNPQRSGWSDAAYKSSIRALNAKFGLNLPGADLMTARLLGSGRTSRSDGGR